MYTRYIYFFVFCEKTKIIMDKAIVKQMRLKSRKVYEKEFYEAVVKKVKKNKKHLNKPYYVL
jgi:hypothetical protein